MSTQLEKAVAYIKSGDKQAGKAVLLRILKTDPANSRAWMYMSAVVNKPEMKRKCLEEAIELQPNNEMARNALAKLNQKYPPPALPEETAVLDNEEQWLPESFREVTPTIKPIPSITPPQHPHSQPNPPPTKAHHDKTERIALLEASIIRELARYRSPKDIAKNLAEKGMDYNQALGLVLFVSQKRKRPIALRRLSIVLLIAVPTFIWGVLLIASVSRFIYGLPLVISSIVGTAIVLKDVVLGDR
ncbi:MAG: hypothetical protein DHS20C20_30400 [Ardenticatenaceae bacterium]|nr:MAG: hypothetical protein DHS20C20_30400 [Ardenticatenaceae bacterium]